MMKLDAITDELLDRKRSDWSVLERVVRRGSATLDGVRRIDDDRRIRLVVHRDVGRGRGTGVLELTGERGDDARAVVDDAEDRALRMIGPAWTTPAPAATARVELEDPELADPELELADVAARVVRGLVGAVDAEVGLEQHAVRLATGSTAGKGLRVKWTETRVTIRAVIGNGGRSGELIAEARRIADLDLEERVRRLIVDLGERATAVPPKPGTYAVVLHAAAHAHGGYGLWHALVGQADAALVRQGLARYRPGRPIAPRATAVDEPLTVISDGTIRFGVRSTPAGDAGEPVRRWQLVDGGVAAGLALDLREAALAREEPNGGVRNLVVPGGTTPLAELVRPGATPVLEVRRLAWLDLDPRTGLAVARVAAGTLHDAAGHHPIAGGTLRLDVIAQLALARRSKEAAIEGPIHGPAALRLDDVAIS
jgi:hypothetical protein